MTVAATYPRGLHPNTLASHVNLKGPKNPSYKHGMSDSPEHRAWRDARGRCRRSTNKSYPDYGGRGIEFDSRWDDFAVFYADMGPRPEGCSLERIDNDGNYSPENCRWGTSAEQNNNRRPRITHAALLRYTTLTHEDLDWIRDQMLGDR